MAYGQTDDEAFRTVKAVALLVRADVIENGEDVPTVPPGSVRRASI
jgi:hypothetical protein